MFGNFLGFLTLKGVLCPINLPPPKKTNKQTNRNRKYLEILNEYQVQQHIDGVNGQNKCKSLDKYPAPHFSWVLFKLKKKLLLANVVQGWQTVIYGEDSHILRAVSFLQSDIFFPACLNKHFFFSILFIIYLFVCLFVCLFVWLVS